MPIKPILPYKFLIFFCSEFTLVKEKRVKLGVGNATFYQFKAWFARGLRAVCALGLF